MAKFRVGQRCVFKFGPNSGWSGANGEECVIVAPRQRVDVWCADLDGGNRNYRRAVVRYGVRWRGGEVWWTAERTLRALDGGEALSTWAKFAKATGIDPRAKPARRKRQSA